MAGRVCTVSASGVLVASTTRTIIQILAPTNQGAYLREFSIGFGGTSGTAAPLVVDLVRQDGAGTSVAATEQDLNNSFGGAIQVAGLTTFTGEPTTSTVLKQWQVHPQTGLIYVVPDPKEFLIEPADRIAIRCVSPGSAVTFRATMTWEE